MILPDRSQVNARRLFDNRARDAADKDNYQFQDSNYAGGTGLPNHWIAGRFV